MAKKDSTNVAIPIVLGIGAFAGAVALLKKKPAQAGPQLAAVGNPTIS